MITLYARQEPTVDHVFNQHKAYGQKAFDTVFYLDRDATKFYCRWSWKVSGRPVRRKTVTLNCYKYSIKYI